MEGAAILHLFKLAEDCRQSHEGKEVDITGLTADSRQVGQGNLFAALDGSLVRGADFIPEALKNGAAAILAPPGVELGTEAPPDTILITDDNPRRRFAEMAARFFSRQPKTIAAVTGTNGKTSTAVFLRELWRSKGNKAASLGSLGVGGDGPISAASLTTPDPVTLHRTLLTLAEAEVEHCVIEASSHGLDQCRLDGVRVSASAFLNLTRDHLDYHGDDESYFAAKERLFSDVMKPGGTAVLNAKAPTFTRLKEVCKAHRHNILTFAGAKSDIRLQSRQDEGFGQRITLDLLGKSYDLFIPLPGAFQIENMMAAAGLAIATGITEDTVASGLPRLSGVRGRLELAARLPGGAPIYVDYAHTPDALAAALAGLRPYVTGRLIVLFGCGGNRDAGKRPRMGEIAADLSDLVFVTDDNPRDEDPASIRREIIVACPEAIEIACRSEAIAKAIDELHDNDVLLIAGKGHEQEQILAGQTIPFDDGEIARRAITARSRCQP